MDSVPITVYLVRMPHWYFLSYAHDDRTDLLKQFHRDLSEQIALQPNVPAVTPGFFDGEGIRLGDPWKTELAGALCASRVFVSLSSPAYFNSDYCGKEFQVFQERQDAFARGHGGSPRLIFPIFWGRPGDDFPLQYTDDEFPPLYGQEGLQHLMNLSSKADDYKQFVRVLAVRLVEAGRKWPMPDLKELRPLDQVHSPFRTREPAAVSAQSTTRSTGRRVAKFVFIAARSEELQKVKSTVDGYAGGGDWQPYLPDDEDPVFLVAQDAATKLKLFFHELPLTGDLATDLETAESNHDIVMLIADAWSLELPQYRDLIRSYDRVTSLNCALLIPVNEAEPETKAHREKLRDTLKKVFQYKTRVSQGIYFQDAIPTADDFKAGLLKTMSQIRGDIINSLSASSTTSAVKNEALKLEAVEQGILALDQTPAVPVPTPE